MLTQLAVGMARDAPLSGSLALSEAGELQTSLHRLKSVRPLQPEREIHLLTRKSVHYRISRGLNDG